MLSEYSARLGTPDEVGADTAQLAGPKTGWPTSSSRRPPGTAWHFA